jgi:hypothetical protein
MRNLVSSRLLVTNFAQRPHARTSFHSLRPEEITMSLSALQALLFPLARPYRFDCSQSRKGSVPF